MPINAALHPKEVVLGGRTDWVDPGVNELRRLGRIAHGECGQKAKEKDSEAQT
jgi:hypothetical protein